MWSGVLNQVYTNKVIQSLGGWESPDMVSHYAQSLTFEEALSLYKSVNPMPFK